MLGHILVQFFGLDNGSGPNYLFWSGIGSDIGEYGVAVGVATGPYLFWRKHNCHTKGCWRIGRHPVEGTNFVVCRHHHPDETPTHSDILRLHKLHLEKRKIG